MARVELEAEGLEATIKGLEKLEKKITPNEILKRLEKSLISILSLHDTLADKGLAPDRKKQKRYSESYRMLKNKRFGKGRGEKPDLVLTGELRSSRVTEVKGPELISFFKGGHKSGLSAGALAKELRRLGFRFHFLTKRDALKLNKDTKKIVEDLTSESLAK